MRVLSGKHTIRALATYCLRWGTSPRSGHFLQLRLARKATLTYEQAHEATTNVPLNWSDIYIHIYVPYYSCHPFIVFPWSCLSIRTLALFCIFRFRYVRVSRLYSHLTATCYSFRARSKIRSTSSVLSAVLDTRASTTCSQDLAFRTSNILHPHLRLPMGQTQEKNKMKKFESSSKKTQYSNPVQPISI